MYASFSGDGVHSWEKDDHFAADVYSYGFLLLELITKQILENPRSVGLFEMQYRKICSPFEEAFLGLAMECVQPKNGCRRPNIHQVVTSLKHYVEELSTRKRNVEGADPMNFPRKREKVKVVTT
ncbi:unnamed protein product [Cuscuta epithymum]|uniref:Serine-threonine/tyrosine-protein kinase catalytic domain-containing protein n=1 Tax=Cuscuta epithymum TaxID=186058 RepID=A0AAV0D327_9ASTE|nr:unnamed protein product [Cuscuta epithymum]